jgi:alpha-L-fucosidase 2
MQPSRRTVIKTGLSATALSFLPSPPSSAQAAAPEVAHSLWYGQPAASWLEALPVGNGRLSAMVFGGIGHDRLALNESTLWSGQPGEAHDNPEAAAHLPRIRQLLFEGQYLAARDLCSQYLLGRKLDFGTHLPLADLLIDWDHEPSQVTQYRRSLDLEQAICRIAYATNSARFTREVFASYPAGVLAVRFTCNRPGSLNLSLRFDPGHLPAESISGGNDALTLTGHAYEKFHSNGQCGVAFEARLQALPVGGRIAATTSSSLTIERANELVLFIAANTTYPALDPAANRRQLEAAASQSWAALRQAHIADHQALYRRVTFDLGGRDIGQTTPTDQRLAAVRQSGAAPDPHLVTLFFQYGRYLTIAGSRPASPLPLNLQGIWNDGRASSMPWTCDFHLDINTQQNYWAAEVCNLSECHAPLFTFLEHLSLAGETTAQNMYRAHGWVAHVVTNPWGFTSPGWGLGWGIFPTGGVWLAMDLWDHYRFTTDRRFLERQAYPVLKQAALFFLDYLTLHPQHGWLVTGPATSPENAFLTPEGQPCSESMGPTCDTEHVRALFQAVRQAAKILGLDSHLQDQLSTALSQLPPLRIGSHGQLMEWLEDFPEAAPNHRHTSHLVALYPYNHITPRATPDLAKAARITIERRTHSAQWEDVEWVRANFVAFYARLYDGESAHQHILGLLAQDTATNLMTYSRSGVAGAEENIFALDGNTGMTGAIAEMLVQSHEGDIHLLPALPSAWPNGSITGLCCRGNVQVDLTWKQGLLDSVTLRSPSGGQFQMRYRQHTNTVSLQPGATASLNANLKPI